MAIQTINCPECSRTQRVDLPPDTRARLEHRPDGDILRITPRVMPITRPERGRPPGSPPGSGDRLTPFTPADDPDRSD